MSFHPIEDVDIKYAGAAWKKGAFDRIDEGFKAEMSPEDFRRFFERYVLENYYSGWTLIAKTNRGKIPVGMLFAELVRKALFIADIVWFPWASNRNKLESTLCWVNGVRDDVVVIEWAKYSQRRHWEHVCRYGIMRRVGTIYDMTSTGEAIAEFQSVARKRRA